MKTKQAVILAAGEGSRLWPLTASTPKPFLPILGRSILQRKLDVLSSFVDEVVLIVGSNKEKIRQALGSKYNGLTLKYVEQEERLGTGHALKSAEKVLEKRFLVLYGDDIYGESAIEQGLSKYPCLVVKKVKDISQYGAVLTEGKLVKGLVEKPDKPISSWANIGVYHLPKEVLSREIDLSKRGEYEITDYIDKLSKSEKVYWKEAQDWKSISYAWDLLDANQIFVQSCEEGIEGKVERGAHIQGPVYVGRGSLIRSGTYIDGPAYIGENCRIGPNSCIRPLSVINRECEIGHSVEIKSSLIFEKSKIHHLGYIGDSVVGRGCNLGAGTITANLRFDNRNVKVMVKGELLDTGRRKFGVVLGDGVKTGIHVSFMPGVMVAPGSFIYPHSLLKRNMGA